MWARLRRTAMCRDFFPSPLGASRTVSFGPTGSLRLRGTARLGGDVRRGPRKSSIRTSELGPLNTDIMLLGPLKTRTLCAFRRATSGVSPAWSRFPPRGGARSYRLRSRPDSNPSHPLTEPDPVVAASRRAEGARRRLWPSRLWVAAGSTNPSVSVFPNSTR